MKTPFEVAGEKLSQVFAEVISKVKPGVSLLELEKETVSLIKKAGGKASFKMVSGYDWATCINLNEGIVHGIPNERKIRSGDVVSLDMGLFWKGWHSDMAYTLQVGKKSSEISSFLEAGKKALELAILQALPGNRVGNISAVIQKTIGEASCACLPELTGHGIGQKLHQEPWVPGVVLRPIEKTPLLKEGMGLAIEVIYTRGKPRMKTEADGWTISTQDGKISALFEKTILVSEKEFKTITPFKFAQERTPGGN